MSNLTPEEHKQRHIMLHAMADELFADYIANHPHYHDFLNMTVQELMRWSHLQTIHPDEPRETSN